MRCTFRSSHALQRVAVYLIPVLSAGFPAPTYSAEPEIGDLLQQIERQERRIKKLEQQSANAELPTHSTDADKHLEWSGYGVVNYLNFDWETDPDRRDAVDVERLIIKLEHDFNSRWSAEAEIEYEHGGTGATLELDKFEEFGEFEQEIEAGGEVVIEELYVTYRQSEAFNLRFGEMIVPIGLLNGAHRPQDYLTVQCPQLRSAGLPGSL